MTMCPLPWVVTAALVGNAVPDAPEDMFGPLDAPPVLDDPKNMFFHPGCQGTTDSCSTCSFKSFSACQHLILQPFVLPRLPHSRCRIWHFVLLNFLWLLIVQPPDLSRRLYRASLPSRESTASSILYCLQTWLVSHPVLHPSHL